MFRKITVLIAVFVFFAACVPRAAAADTGSLKGKTIILDAGHGYGNTNTYAGYDEQVAMFKLAQKIKPLLEARGATVHMTRPTQADVSLYKRAALINMWAMQTVKSASARTGGDAKEIDRLIGVLQNIIDNPQRNAAAYMNAPYSTRRKISTDLKKIFDYENTPEVYNRFLVISLHSNATATPINTAAQGADIFIASGGSSYYNYSNVQRSSSFGNYLLAKFPKLGVRRNIINSSNLLMVREHNLPGVLVENGFHTNKSDRTLLLSDAFLERLASEYADAISEYFSALGA